MPVEAEVKVRSTSAASCFRPELISVDRWPTERCSYSVSMRMRDVAGVLLQRSRHVRGSARDGALGLVRSRADRLDGIGGELGERALGLACIAADRLAELLHARHDRVADRLTAYLDLRRHGLDA